MNLDRLERLTIEGDPDAFRAWKRELERRDAWMCLAPQPPSEDDEWAWVARHAAAYGLPTALDMGEVVPSDDEGYEESPLFACGVRRICRFVDETQTATLGCVMVAAIIRGERRIVTHRRWYTNDQRRKILHAATHCDYPIPIAHAGEPLCMERAMSRKWWAKYEH